jgi:hypothetical protein
MKMVAFVTAGLAIGALAGKIATEEIIKIKERNTASAHNSSRDVSMPESLLTADSMNEYFI